MARETPGTSTRNPPKSRISKRITRLLHVVQAYASLDFSHRADVGPDGDDLDALAAGINMLGEEVRTSQEELEARVNERTQRLSELTDNLQSEIAARRKNESAVREANEHLQETIQYLEEVNREIEKLTELSNMMQVCEDRDEAFAVLGDVGPELFDGTEGSVSVFLPSRDLIRRVAAWGDSFGEEATCRPEDCWALRRGRPHYSRTKSGLRCNHVPREWAGETLCVPLIAQGETTGLLQLRWTGSRDKAGDRMLSDDPKRTRFNHYEKLAVAASEQIALALSNLELRAALRAQSIRDPLTGVFNRRFMDETLVRELTRSERNKDPLTFLMLDVDHFKHFNDTYGHDAGDAVLKSLAELVQTQVRVEDVVCRFGGEEFAIIMAGADAHQAAERAEMIRESIDAADFQYLGQPTAETTISIGVAAFPTHAHARESLVKAADRALYQAKEQGRNRVVISDAEPAETKAESGEPPPSTS